MDEQSVLKLMRNWGYYLLPKSHDDSPGHSGLLVAIRKQPTGQHFDPQAMRLRLRDERGIARWRISDRVMPLQESAHVCPGHVILRDRHDKSVEFFTFGGSLEVTSGPGEFVYVLRSPAPILELTAHETIADLLADETESLMAEVEARWGQNEEGFNRRLAEADPIRFYAAVMQTILLHYERAQALEKAYHAFHEELLREKAWLVAQGLWLTEPFAFKDLLSPQG
jgi:hypothetical protein